MNFFETFLQMLSIFKKPYESPSHSFDDDRPRRIQTQTKSRSLPFTSTRLLRLLHHQHLVFPVHDDGGHDVGDVLPEDRLEIGVNVGRDPLALQRRILLFQREIANFRLVVLERRPLQHPLDGLLDAVGHLRNVRLSARLPPEFRSQLCRDVTGSTGRRLTGQEVPAWRLKRTTAERPWNARNWRAVPGKLDRPYTLRTGAVHLFVVVR